MFSSSYPARASKYGADSYNSSSLDSEDEEERRLCLLKLTTNKTHTPSLSSGCRVLLSPPSPRPPLGKQNARSFFHSSYHAGLDNCYQDPMPHYSSESVREQTAELANIALSNYGTTPPRALLCSQASDDEVVAFRMEEAMQKNQIDSENPGRHMNLFRQLSVHRSSTRRGSDPYNTCSTPSEGDPLIQNQYFLEYGTAHRSHSLSPNDPESQSSGVRTSPTANSIRLSVITRLRLRFLASGNTRTYSGLDLWHHAITQPLKYLPAVVLGLLLNVLDGLSYGMILFPLSQGVFSDLGPDGLSMFYVSCIVSQLVFSCGGSVFKGGIGSEMIEVVPFFHKMAFTILNQVGRDQPKTVIATTILAYSTSAILTGVVFFVLGAAKLGSLIGFFPRHILVGCIGGVGFFLMATGIEVSARLEGKLKYDVETLVVLLEPKTFFLWAVPLLLASLLILMQRYIKSALFMPVYLISIPAFFYITVLVFLRQSISHLRESGWIFDAPAANVPFWHFYTLFDFKCVDWNALLKTIPAMFALTFFGILHVPINVPALGVSTGQDSVDVNRELIAHGVSNVLSGCAGSIQNYLVYSNSILFVRAGGESRIAGVLLAIGTAAMMVSGPSIIGFIPVMVVGALIFLLGIELLKEALWDTAGKLSMLEYLTILAIVITMGAWDFVIGILVGVILACASFVVQTAQKSPIRATYTGVIARSTVRRHPLQQRFLKEVGKQIRVVKLSGYMFFGTISTLESWVRNAIAEINFQQQPIRFLIIDLLRVSGIDFSAAEAFTRMRRLLAKRNVEMILSGVTPGGEVAKSLRAVGVWANGETVLVFRDLNSALESCENEFLTALYAHREEESRKIQGLREPANVDIPQSDKTVLGDLVFHGSPRRAFVQNAATNILTMQESLQSSKWQTFKQPLPLMLQIFQEITHKNEDFWFRALPFFKRRTYAPGVRVFSRGDRATEFYLVEEGILHADYDLDQGRYSESILAGTSCGELPFFSDTARTASVVAEKETIAWVLDRKNWQAIQEMYPDIASELLTVALKLTTERMHAITSYIYVGT